MFTDAVAKHLIKMLQERFDNWVFIYDETRAIKTGEKQFGLHFFRNHRYQKRNTNQSKSFGHSLARWGCFVPRDRDDSVSGVGEPDIPRPIGTTSVLKRICSQIPPGLIIFDRGFNRRKVFEAVLSAGHHLLCRAKLRSFICSYGLQATQRDVQRHTVNASSLRHLRYKAIDIDQTVFSRI